MKRVYSAPTVEKVEFRYSEQIMASGIKCDTYQGISNPAVFNGSSGCCEWVHVNPNQ